MNVKPPNPGQAVYVFNQRERRAERLVFVKRNRSWHYFTRDGVPLKFNGCPEWHEHASQSCWAAFGVEVEYAGALMARGRRSEAAVERVFSIACEYVRQFSAELNKEPGQVWEDRRSSAKPEGVEP